MNEQEQALNNPNLTGLGPKTEAEKTEKNAATEKRVEENFPERE